MAARHNFIVRQGAKFAPVITLVNTDGGIYELTDHTARMQARRRQQDSTTVIDWTSAAGDMVIDVAAGTITFDVSSTETAALDFSQAIYDLEIVDGGGEATRILYGYVLFDREVTR